MSRPRKKDRRKWNRSIRLFAAAIRRGSVRGMGPKRRWKQRIKDSYMNYER